MGKVFLLKNLNLAVDLVSSPYEVKPIDSFLLNALKGCLGYMDCFLKLCKLISGCAIALLSVWSYLGEFVSS